VLVTGGAGFIGSHLVDSLVSEGARRLTVVDNFFLGSPANLDDVRRRMPDLQIVAVDASDEQALRKLFAQLGPVDVVFDYVADQSNEPQYNPRMVRAASGDG